MVISKYNKMIVNPPQLNQLNLMLELLKDPDRKPLLKMAYELLVLFARYKELPLHYFRRYLFKKDIKNISCYLPDHFLSKKVAPVFYNKSVKEILDNKLFFDMLYRQLDLKIPVLLLYNHKRRFVSGKKCIEINSTGDLRLLLEDVFAENPMCDSIFIKKTYSSSSGRNIYKLTPEELRSDSRFLNDVCNEVINSEYIFQQAVIQHPQMNVLNPASLNTIRIDTFVDCNGKADIISAYLRMSTNSNYIDNISAGGCMVGIDLNSGKLKKYGFPSISHGVNSLTRHPVTGTVFENFEIPYFPEVIKLVIRAASYMPCLRLVGWDVGISESGPVIIEGNSDYAINANDWHNGGYAINPVFRKVLLEVEEKIDQEKYPGALRVDP